MTDRPVTDEIETIEITPEMIRAEALELAGYNPDFESRDGAVSRIYSQMFAARAIPPSL